LSGINKLLGKLCENFRRIGVKVALLDFSNPEAIGGKITYLYTAYDPYEGIQHVGSMKIEEQYIDQLQVFTRQVPGDISGFRWYDVHFLISGDPKGMERSLTVDLRFKSALFGGKKAKWEGGNLARRLNDDEELRKRFLHINRPCRIRPDNQYKCVRIIVQMNRKESADPEKMISKVMECFPACNKIAQHIHKEIRNTTT